MKKLTLAIAVLAVLTITLFSFTKSPDADDQNTYIWVRMGCQAFGSAQPGIGWFETSSPDMLQGNCPENQPSGICAVQFHRSQVTCEGAIITMRDGNTFWGSYRMIKYCSQ